VLLSLVAELEGRIVGHVLFSRVEIETSSALVPAVALAPVAVLPDSQRRGIGATLIRAGLDALREADETIAIVLGDPDYYARYGFSAEAARSIASPFRPEHFMALALREGSLDDVRGRVVYPAAFGL